jgi:hypothetical protein
MKQMARALCGLLVALWIVAPAAAQNEGQQQESREARRAARQQQSKERDEAHFAMIEQHVRTMEECMAMIRKLSTNQWGNFHIVHPNGTDQENYDAQKIARYTQMKTDASYAIEEIISRYFLSARLQYPEGQKAWRGDPYDRRSLEAGAKPEESPLMPSYLNYTRMNFYLHKALVYNVWARELTLPEKPRAVRSLMARFREMWEDPKNEEWHDNRLYPN